jgi:hypothetical protein
VAGVVLRSWPWWLTDLVRLMKARLPKPPGDEDARRFPHPGRPASLNRRSSSATPPGGRFAYTYFRKDENKARQAKVLADDDCASTSAR